MVLDNLVMILSRFDEQGELIERFSEYCGIMSAANVTGLLLVLKLNCQ